MTQVIDPFKADGYSMAEMTAAINVLPNMYGMINDRNLFPAEGVTNRNILIERDNGLLNLLVSKPVDAAPSQGVDAKRKTRPFVIPHFPHSDYILPSAVSGIRSRFDPAQAMTLEQEIVRKEGNCKRKHDITLEFLRAGALAGVIVDGDGTTIYDLYSEFGIAEKTVDFVLGTTTTNIITKIEEVKEHIEDNLLGDVMTDIEIWVDSTFWKKFIVHDNVKDAYRYFANNGGGNPLRDDVRPGFRHGDVTWRVYRGRATQLTAAGTQTTRPFIAAGTGRAFPIGTLETFKTFFAPAEMNETVNTVGLPYYARMEPRRMGKGYDIYTESNPLPLCRRPEVLVKVYSSN